MLNKFRQQHMKTCLWILASVVIVAFILSGSSTLFFNTKNKIVAKTKSHKFKISDFQHYLKLTKLFFILNLPKANITYSDLENTAKDLLVLTWKAKEDKIRVKDEEVIQYIINNFFQGNYNKISYEKLIKYLSQNYQLALTTRNFEELIRELILVNKLFEKYINVRADEEEIRNLYLRDNQKAKINYLYIPYEKFEITTEISKQELEQFYAEKKSFFKRKPTIRIKYLIVDSDIINEQNLSNFLKINSLEELSKKLSLQIKETGYISLDDPIEEIGWLPEINKIAFKLKKNETSPFIEIDKGLIIMEKIEDKESYIPPLSEIIDEVRRKLIKDKAKEEATKVSDNILKEINNSNLHDLKKIADKTNLNFKSVDNIGYNSYIEGLGLDKNVSEIIFSLSKGEIYPKSIFLINGIYIIQLVDITALDNEDFQKNKEKYQELILANKTFEEKVKFLDRLKADFKFYY
ncbi:MAG: peptidyl-prolyl cis-trans isomerase [Candidatus Omnitrophica bacterium]|jgi:hypothetical protein|nr:peptidyl-prolyl cis-trans isomerase [Candidatus Omnitrophota bacterium]